MYGGYFHSQRRIGPSTPLFIGLAFLGLDGVFLFHGGLCCCDDDRRILVGISYFSRSSFEYTCFFDCEKPLAPADGLIKTKKDCTKTVLFHLMGIVFVGRFFILVFFPAVMQFGSLLVVEGSFGQRIVIVSCYLIH